MRNSKYPTFDSDYAQDLKENWPQIWRRGGNIEGNNQYRRLLPIVTRKNKKAETETEEKAIKKREAWAARHLQDFRIAGTVAQIKWFVIGSKGLSYMKKLINDEKKRLSDKNAREKIWKNWVEKRQGPSEKKLQRSAFSYLEDAKHRYKRRIKEFVKIQKDFSSGAEHVKTVLSWEELLAIGEEINQIIVYFGRDWMNVWATSGNEELESVYKKAKKKRPEDLAFGEPDIARSYIDQTAMEIAQTTAKEVKKIVENGLLAGSSINDLAIALDNSVGLGLSRSRMIARTESTKAINLAANQSYQTAANEGINIQKEWLSSRDDKVRPTHQDLDGDIIGVNEAFLIPPNQTSMVPGGFDVMS